MVWALLAPELQNPSRPCESARQAPIVLSSSSRGHDPTAGGGAMKRREFITLIGGAAAAWPLAARAQQEKSFAHIGLLSPFSPPAAAPWHEAFRQGLRSLGWIEGKNIEIHYRYAEGRDDRLPTLIADLVRLRVDVIVTSVTNDALAAKNAV